MKKILNKIGELILTLVGCLLAIVFGVCLIFVVPFDYIRYKRSFYYKIERKKYELFAGTGIYFELYNEIAKNKLPIKYIFNPKNDAVQCGWFVYNNILIIPNDFPFEYDVERRQWRCCCDGGEVAGAEKEIIITLDEYMEMAIEEANELVGNTICDKAVLLIDADDIEDIEAAKKEEYFLLYDNNREEVLKSFCNKNLEISDKSVSARPDWETIVRIMKDKSLDCFVDEVIKVIYSRDNTRRYVILKNKDAILTYHLENLYPYDDEDWKYISAVEDALPAMWESQSDWCSRFEREDDLMKALVNEPEYKQFFL